MAAYATATEITSEFKNTTFSSGDPVTETEVGAWCTDFSNVVDMVIGVKYQVPATSTTLVGFCKLIVKNYVAARVRRILNGPGDKTAAELQEQADDLLNQITEGKIGDPLAPSASGVGCVSYNQENDKQPHYEIDTDAW